MSAEAYLRALIEADERYDDRLWYSIFPMSPVAYNSNSCAIGFGSGDWRDIHTRCELGSLSRRTNAGTCCSVWVFRTVRSAFILSLLVASSCSVGWHKFYFMFPDEENVNVLEFEEPDLDLYRGMEIPSRFVVQLPDNQVVMRVKLQNLSPSIDLKTDVPTHVAGGDCLHVMDADGRWNITYVCAQSEGRKVDLILTYLGKREVVVLSLALAGEYLLIDSF
jgi:hypothetical protein